jgi:D-psicose/D-tagatose/L-ribulose 3-epimerase
MKFAICNETFQGWDWERTCRYVSAAGYDGIEIAPFTLAEDIRSVSSTERASIRNTAMQNGLEIVGLHWLLVSPKGLSVTTADVDVRKQTSDYLVALVDFCADVGGKIMVFGSPNQRRIPEGETREVAADRFLESIRPALDRAGVNGITICLEPLPPPEADFLLTLKEARSLVKKLDHPAAKTIFDVKSASSEGIPLPELIRECAPHIAHVHANDSNRRGPGFGETNFKPVLSTLKAISYSGYVSVEVFDYSPDPKTIATESLKYLRSCLS